MIVKVKYHADITRLEKIKEGDMIDLRCAEEVHMKQGEYKLISLGVNINHQNKDGNTALIYSILTACKYNNYSSSEGIL